MVKADSLIKQYGKFNLDVSLEVPDGYITGLVGKNGAGKSTTIKLILGLIKPDAGSVTVFGKNANELTGKDKQRLGVTLSCAGFSDYLNMKDVTKILRKMYTEFDEEWFKSSCVSMNIPADKKLKDFSTGMRAKLRMLIALSHRAELLVLDEPTAGLDVDARNRLLDMLRDYLEKNPSSSILITSHISGDLEGLCDDIYMLHDGRIVLHEDTDVLLDKYAVIKVDEAAYEKIDKSYILKTKKGRFGYSCFTNEKQFYIENYPGIIVENGGIDDLILMYSGGEK
jgi:ABC-2 type transport system ATP-binding protein